VTIVRHFLLWAQSATPRQRSDAVRSLARAFLGPDLSPQDRSEAETALTAMLDDRSPLVRRAIAEELGASDLAPQAVVLALAHDQSDIAALVLQRSPVLGDPDLVDCAALGDDLVQIAIAMRNGLSVGVAAAIVEIGSLEAVVALAENRSAAITETSLARMIERYGEHPVLREALLARAGLPLPVRQSIAILLSRALSDFAVGCGWLPRDRSERIVREACETTTIALSREGCERDVERLVAHLRATSQLTPALILRALLSCNLAFVEAAFSELAKYPAQRVRGILRDARFGFPGLYARAGLPAAIRPAFEVALSVLRGATAEEAGTGLCRRMIQAVLAACDTLPPEEVGKLVALLRRFDSEAAREEARHLAAGLAEDARRSWSLAHQTGVVIEGDETDAESRQAA
jgi:uncharacterized protein (DUF2336 family)